MKQQTGTKLRITLPNGHRAFSRVYTEGRQLIRTLEATKSSGDTGYYKAVRELTGNDPKKITEIMDKLRVIEVVVDDKLSHDARERALLGLKQDRCTYEFV